MCVWARRARPWPRQDILVHQERWLFPLRDIRRTVSKGNWHGSLRPWWFPLRFFYSRSIGLGNSVPPQHLCVEARSPSAETGEERRLTLEYNFSCVHVAVSFFINNHLGGSAAPVDLCGDEGAWAAVIRYHNLHSTPVWYPPPSCMESARDPRWNNRKMWSHQASGAPLRAIIWLKHIYIWSLRYSVVAWCKKPTTTCE